MVDPDPLHVDGSFVLFYEKVETGTECGKVKLIDSYGYTYTVKRKYAHSTEWQCTIRNKKVKFKVTVKEKSNTFVEGPQSHCHHPSLSRVCCQNIIKNIITKASEFWTCS